MNVIVNELQMQDQQYLYFFGISLQNVLIYIYMSLSFLFIIVIGKVYLLGNNFFFCYCWQFFLLFLGKVMEMVEMGKCKETNNGGYGMLLVILA